MPKASRLRTYFLIAAILCVGSGVLLNVLFKSIKLNEAEYLQAIEAQLNNEVDIMQKELVHVIQFVEQENRVDFNSFNTDSTHPFYVYKNGKLVYWSDYRFIPDYRYIKGNYKFKFVRTARKDFLTRKWAIAGTEFEIYALIPLYDDYKVDNNYVQSGYNKRIFSDQKLLLYPIDQVKGNNVCLRENQACYFKVKFENDYLQNRAVLDYTISFLVIAGIIFFVIWIYAFARKMSIKNVEFAILYLALVLIFIRASMLYFNFPEGLLPSSLFNSRYFASSVLNPSLGDLLLNFLVTLILTIFIFSNYTAMNFSRWLITCEKSKKQLISILLAFGMLLLLHSEYLIFQTIYHNSQITFDVNQSITFGLNRMVGFVIVIMLSAIIFLVNHILYKFFRKVNSKKREMVINFFIGLLLFVVINLIIGQQFIEVAIIGALWAMILWFTTLPDYLSKIRYNTFLYIFVGIIAFSILGAIAIFNFEKERVFDKKQKFATQFLIENDNLAEFLLADVNEKLKNDVFIQSRMASPFLSKEIIKSKIKQVYLSNYFDKYDVKIYLFNSNAQPFEENTAAINSEELKAFNVDKYKTSYNGIFYINKLDGEITKRYLDFVQMKKRGISLGYIIIDLNLKRIIPDNVYPELLVDNAFLFPYQDANYSYAVYSNNTVLFNSGSFNYTNDFDNSVLQDENIYKEGISSKGFSHLAVKDTEGKIVVISSELNALSGLFSNFSFLFLLLVFTLLLLTILYVLYFSFQQVSLNYSARIQLYLNMAFFLPLFAVSITTLSLINSSFKKEVNEEYYKKARNIGTNISSDLDHYVTRINFDQDELPNKLSQVAKYSGVDVNLFNTSGRLIATSQPLIYENNLLSKNINPEAIRKIKENGENAYIARESVGELSFNTTYFGVKSYDTGNLMGILSIPFFQSEYALEQNQIEVLSNVINIFTIIFIVFLLISYFAAKWLTFPLAFITQKLKKTTLTGFNEPLIWKTDDEIGLMVGEYNRMLINLEESKKALAKSEKESAWREIAQQVAHEIKNPLTPMKLTLQHMSRKLLGHASEKDFEKPIGTLLHEIETLNDIATSFSSFATMPIPENERYDFIPIIIKTVNLHHATKGAKVLLNIPDYPIYTMGDEQLMGRIISNIIINAIQSSTKETLIEIDLLTTENNRLLLEIKDNGSGINESIHSKIFVPNFSTKETGSGIGLAIAKHGIEHAGGKIWFETEMNKGTTFFIELPMVE